MLQNGLWLLNNNYFEMVLPIFLISFDPANARFNAYLPPASNVDLKDLPLAAKNVMF